MRRLIWIPREVRAIVHGIHVTLTRGYHLLDDGEAAYVIGNLNGWGYER